LQIDFIHWGRPKSQIVIAALSRDPAEYTQFGIPGQARNDTSIDILTFWSVPIHFSHSKIFQDEDTWRLEISIDGLPYFGVGPVFSGTSHTG